MVARDLFTKNQFQCLQSVEMHELGHLLSIGWRDDTAPPYPLLGIASPKACEVYSGNQKRLNLNGDLDPTLENVFTNITVTESESRWRVETTARMRDNIGRGFRNVTVVGRTSNGDIICRESIGNMSIKEYQSEITVKMPCSEFPSAIVPLTEESPCADAIYINKQVYDDKSETWREVQVECRNG